MDELAAAAASVAVDDESEAEEDLEQRAPGGAESGAKAGASAFEAFDRGKENYSGDAAPPRLEDAKSKVCTLPSVPCCPRFA